MHAIFTFHSGYIPIKQVFKRAGGDKLYIPFWIYSNDIKNKVLIFDDNFTFHSGYIPIGGFCTDFIFKSIFTFHSGYIPILILALVPALLYTLHSILDIFQSVSYHTTYLRHLKPYFLSTSIFSTGKVWFSCNSTVYVLL